VALSILVVFNRDLGIWLELEQALQNLNKALRDAKEKEWSSKLQVEDRDERVV
jgi:hypothetical protein